VERAAGRRRVEFVHTLTDESGHGYVYVKTLRLPDGKPELILEHSLENTGRKPIETSVYNHNFIVIDGQPTGPDFVIKVPFEIEAARDRGGFAETRGKQVVYLRELQADQRRWSRWRGSVTVRRTTTSGWRTPRRGRACGSPATGR